MLWGGPEGARVQVILYGLEVPSSSHGEMTLFCAAANRFFATWNLYLAPSADVRSSASGDSEFVVSAGQFLAGESRGQVPPEVVQGLVLHAVRAAFVAAPAVRALIGGADTREAIAIANEYDDTIGESWLPKTPG
jgi:hypothetical protein